MDKGKLSPKHLRDIQEHIFLNIERVKAAWADVATEGDIAKIEYMGR